MSQPKFSLNKGHNGFCGGNLGSADDQDQANTKTICCKLIITIFQQQKFL